MREKIINIKNNEIRINLVNHSGAIINVIIIKNNAIIDSNISIK